MKESEVLRIILNKLGFLYLMNEIIWFKRLHSGQFGRVRVGNPGDPDIVVVISKNNGTLALLFLEVKKLGVKRLRFEQKKFFKEMLNKRDVFCEVINDPKQLGKIIDKVKNGT